MIYIGSDHAGFELKKEIFEFIKEKLKMEIEDLGTYSQESVDFPDVAVKVCKKVTENNGTGILICGTGIGMCMAANKIKGIRCAVCAEEYSAKMTRAHNDANVLALGGRTTGPELAKSIVEVFLTTKFEGGRHTTRVDKINNL